MSPKLAVDVTILTVKHHNNNPFLLHVAVPKSFSTMAEITPTTSLIVEIPETSENPTQ